MNNNSFTQAWMRSWHGPIPSNDEQPQVPPTPTPSEEPESQPARPTPVAKETLLLNKGGASWARNNTNTSTDLDPLVLPPSGLRQRQRPPTRSTSSGQGLKRK